MKKLFTSLFLVLVCVFCFFGFSSVKPKATTNEYIYNSVISLDSYSNDLLGEGINYTSFGNFIYKDVYIFIPYISWEDYNNHVANNYLYAYVVGFDNFEGLQDDVNLICDAYIKYINNTLIPSIGYNSMYDYFIEMFDLTNLFIISINSINYKIDYVNRQIVDISSNFIQANNMPFNLIKWNYWIYDNMTVYNEYISSNQVKDLENALAQQQKEFNKEIFNYQVQIDNLNETIQNNLDNYNSSIPVIKDNAYNQGYQEGLNAGASSDFTLRTLLGTIFNYPLLILTEGLNIEIWGINLGGLILFILCIGIVWIIIKLILKFLRG